MEYLTYLKEFLIGGSIIASSKYVAKYVGAEFAPLVGGMPTGIIASFFLNSEVNKKEFYSGYVISSFILFLAIVFIRVTNKYFPRISTNIVSVIAIILWAVISFLVIYRLK